MEQWVSRILQSWVNGKIKLDKIHLKPNIPIFQLSKVITQATLGVNWMTTAERRKLLVDTEKQLE